MPQARRCSLRSQCQPPGLPDQSGVAEKTVLRRSYCVTCTGDRGSNSQYTCVAQTAPDRLSFGSQTESLIRHRRQVAKRQPKLSENRSKWRVLAPEVLRSRKTAPPEFPRLATVVPNCREANMARALHKSRADAFGASRKGGLDTAFLRTRRLRAERLPDRYRLPYWVLHPGPTPGCSRFNLLQLQLARTRKVTPCRCDSCALRHFLWEHFVQLRRLVNAVQRAPQHVTTKRRLHHATPQPRCLFRLPQP
jgi:hypothetical protein